MDAIDSIQSKMEKTLSTIVEGYSIQIATLESLGTAYLNPTYVWLAHDLRQQAREEWERMKDIYESAADVYLDITRQYQGGTGMQGLPRTGPFIGHKGEIVLSPTESEEERKGRAKSVTNITIAPTFMSGDKIAARAVANEIAEALEDRNNRIH